MPTYSLTLREEKGFKLTTQELDENFLYVLQNASGGSGATGPQGDIGPQGPTGPGGAQLNCVDEYGASDYLPLLTSSNTYLNYDSGILSKNYKTTTFISNTLYVTVNLPLDVPAQLTCLVYGYQID